MVQFVELIAQSERLSLKINNWFGVQIPVGSLFSICYLSIANCSSIYIKSITHYIEPIAQVERLSLKINNWFGVRISVGSFLLFIKYEIINNNNRSNELNTNYIMIYFAGQRFINLILFFELLLVLVRLDIRCRHFNGPFSLFKTTNNFLYLFLLLFLDLIYLARIKLFQM